MPREGLGIGVAVWDQYMTHSDVPSLIREAGFKVIRYPGGSYSDLYHWETHTSTKGYPATIRPKTDFDSFMSMAHKSRAQPLITVNYGSNQEGTDGASPDEAARWVAYANRTKGWNVKYWEIGNEVYGNGFYNGQGWEMDLHAPDSEKKEDRLQNPKLGPTAYGTNLLAFIKAMKKVDNTIKVGAILTTPGGWPDGVAPDWNKTVLGIAGKKIDFVVVHWYGEGRTPAAILDSHSQVPSICGKLKDLIKTYCGGRKVQIWMTEGDASGWNTRAPGALFAADHFPTWIENGATHVDWWDLHNGAVKTFDGTLDDQGILSNASSVGGMNEPPLSTPFPPYFGVQMVDRLVKPGDWFIRVHSSAPSLLTHAVAKGKGVAVMLINTDSEHPAEVDLSVAGWPVTRATSRYDYEAGAKGIRQTKLSGKESRVTVSPLGITNVTLEKGLR